MRIVVVSNDITPEFGLPVAAPGLRAWSLAQGLRSHGHDVDVVVAAGPVRKASPGGIPATAPGVVTIDLHRLDEYVATHAPDAVVFTNSNHVEQLGDLHDALLVYDFFAPKMLERGFSAREGALDLAAMRSLRDRKVRALQRADIIALNGPKKHGYALAWLLQCDRDPASVPIVDVPFGVPPMPPRIVGGPLRLAVTGYVQAWSGAGGALEQLLTAMDEVAVEVHLVLARHWGGDRRSTGLGDYERLLEHDACVQHDPMPFEDFRVMLQGMDATIDLFEHHLEREYAMVTRTLVSLCTGAAAIHPDYTEVADLIRSYEAGWLLQRDAGDLVDICRALAENPDEVRRRRTNAARLARELLDPVEATRALSDELEARA